MTGRTLDALAAAINAAHSAVLSAARTTTEQAIRAGELLIEAKAQLAHGEWLPWLAANCPDLSKRVANLWMALARESNALRAEAAKRESNSLLPIGLALRYITDAHVEPDTLAPGGKPDDDQLPEEPEPDDPDPDPDPIRMVRLLFRESQYRAFDAQLRAVMADLGTTDVTATVVELVRRAYGRKQVAA